MTPKEKQVIGKFYHPKTIQMVMSGHNSKTKKKTKMLTLYAVAIDKKLHDTPPGRWIVEMDRKFRNGEP